MLHKPLTRDSVPRYPVATSDAQNYHHTALDSCTETGTRPVGTCRSGWDSLWGSAGNAQPARPLARLSTGSVATRAQKDLSVFARVPKRLLPVLIFIAARKPHRALSATGVRVPAPSAHSWRQGRRQRRATKRARPGRAPFLCRFCSMNSVALLSTLYANAENSLEV